MRNLLFAAILCMALSASAQTESYLLIGTYTSNSTSKGIHVYRFNTSTGAASFVSEVPCADPSFLAISPNKKFVYAVNEVGGKNHPGEIAAFAFNNQTGVLTQLNSEPSGGDHPCYVNIDKSGKWVLSGNYTGGSFAVLPVQKDGSLGKPAQIIQHTGSGPNKNRQEKPHVHSTLFTPDQRFILVPDLGIDKVMTYAFNSATGNVKPAAAPFTSSAPGAGPRHFDFHRNGKFGYLVEEMAGTVSAFRYSNGKLTRFQTINMLPADYKGDIGAADIHVSPDGKFLYASNRGQSNTIVIYQVEAITGKLSLIGHQPTMGTIPRNFNFDLTGNFLLVANQESNNVVIFKRDLKTGLLTDTGNRIEVGKPVCLKFIPVQR